MSIFSAPESAVKSCVRAKYIPTSDGLRLAMVQSFSAPMFRRDGWECDKPEKGRAVESVESVESFEDKTEPDISDVERASRRAKINAFDIIMSNPDLDVFSTFTYKPDEALDKSSYDDCYKKLGIWLSNRVQRHGLKYVIVPERHKSGDIHFHGILNSSAISLTPALSPKTGRQLTEHGKPIYNMPEWKHGFTTAQLIGSDESDRDKVSKYIFKYMGKQVGQKIGGRYCLIGGDLARPVYAYGDSPDEFMYGHTCVYDRSVTVNDGLTYKEWSFV